MQTQDAQTPGKKNTDKLEARLDEIKKLRGGGRINVAPPNPGAPTGPRLAPALREDRPRVRTRGHIG